MYTFLRNQKVKKKKLRVVENVKNSFYITQRFFKKGLNENRNNKSANITVMGRRQFTE